MLLTLREASKETLSVHGPPGISDFLTASQCFLTMNNVDLKCSEHSKDGEVYKDENIIVTAIPIKGNYHIHHIECHNQLLIQSTNDFINYSVL